MKHPQAADNEENRVSANTAIFLDTLVEIQAEANRLKATNKADRKPKAPKIIDRAWTLYRTAPPAFLPAMLSIAEIFRDGSDSDKANLINLVKSWDRKKQTQTALAVVGPVKQRKANYRKIMESAG